MSLSEVQISHMYWVSHINWVAIATGIKASPVGFVLIIGAMNLESWRGEFGNELHRNISPCVTVNITCGEDKNQMRHAKRVEEWSIRMCDVIEGMQTPFQRPSSWSCFATLSFPLWHRHLFLSVLITDITTHKITNPQLLNQFPRIHYRCAWLAKRILSSWAWLTDISCKMYSHSLCIHNCHLIQTLRHNRDDDNNNTNKIIVICFIWHVSGA